MKSLNRVFNSLVRLVFDLIISNSYEKLKANIFLKNRICSSYLYCILIFSGLDIKKVHSNFPRAFNEMVEILHVWMLYSSFLEFMSIKKIKMWRCLLLNKKEIKCWNSILKLNSGEVYPNQRKVFFISYTTEDFVLVTKLL